MNRVPSTQFGQACIETAFRSADTVAFIHDSVVSLLYMDRGCASECEHTPMLCTPCVLKRLWHIISLD